jgi:hypothetical protein
MRHRLVCLGCIVSLSALLPMQEVAPPATLAPPGSAPLGLVSRATRTHLLGLIDLYTIAIYANQPLDPLLQMLSASTAKALRIEVMYQEDLRRHLPFDWRRELVPALEAAPTAHLRGVFAPLKRGDVVVVDYVPARGTSVRINKSVAVPDAHHDLMVAFLDHWMGQRPVSEEMKRALLAPR